MKNKQPLDFIKARMEASSVKPTRCAQVNKALRAAGFQEELVRGNGYFYFVGGDAASWPSSSVLVYSITGLTVAQWIAERDLLAADSGRA
jgi:hypothetical protein